MNCALCTKDDSVLCLVPKLDGPSDWSGDQLVCRECAIEQGVYCTTHERPHVYYFELGTACIWCVNETVRKMGYTAVAVYQRIIQALPPPEIDRINEWTDDMPSDEITLVFRSVVQLSHIRKCSLEETVQQIIQSRSADSLVPAAY